jgi:hypothetical protein
MLLTFIVSSIVKTCFELFIKAKCIIAKLTTPKKHDQHLTQIPSIIAAYHWIYNAFYPITCININEYV